MAYDKVVDSTQLNADLTSVANAIRTKGGTSAQLAFPSGFVSAIGDISADLTELTLMLGLNPIIQEYLLPDTITSVKLIRQNKNTALTNGRICSMALSMFDVNSNIETITIDYGIVKPVNANDIIRGTNIRSTNITKLKTIHFYVDTSSIITFDRFLYFTSANKLHDVVIDGTPIDFSSMTSWNNTLDFDGLKEIRFVPDKIAVSSVTINNVYTEEYSADTWASLANALKTGHSGTLAIGSTAQATISAIMGVNNSGLFVIDQSGSLSLSDFITTVKGWTLA